MTRPLWTALAWAAGLLGASALAFALGSYHTDIYRKMLIWVAMALSFNFLFGVAGQVAFSHFSFASIGAYGVVILSHQLGLPFGLALLAAVLICALLAFVVAAPATRLEGFYLALATLAFSQLVRVMIDEGGALTGGTGGLANYRLPPVLGMDLRGPWYTICLVLLVAATLWILQRVDGSWFGRACRAVRDNPRAAEAMGVNLARTKILVFVLTSTLAGLAGIGYAYVDNVINPSVFGLDNTFLLLFMIIIGGSGRHAGAMLGAVVLYLSPFALEPLVGNHYMLIFGLLIVLSILFRPDGLIGLLSPAKQGRAI